MANSPEEMNPQVAALIKAQEKALSLADGIESHVRDVRRRQRRCNSLKLFDFIDSSGEEAITVLRSALSRHDHPDHQLLLMRAERYAKGEAEIKAFEKAIKGAEEELTKLQAAEMWMALSKRRNQQARELEALEDSLAKERYWVSDSWKTCARMLENMAAMKQRQLEHTHKMEIAGLSIESLTDAQLEEP